MSMVENQYQELNDKMILLEMEYQSFPQECHSILKDIEAEILYYRQQLQLIENQIEIQDNAELHHRMCELNSLMDNCMDQINNVRMQ